MLNEALYLHARKKHRKLVPKRERKRVRKRAKKRAKVSA